MKSTTDAEIVESVTSMVNLITPWLDVVDDRRLAVCPVCRAGPVWRNGTEFVEHALACSRIAVKV